MGDKYANHGTLASKHADDITVGMRTTSVLGLDAFADELRRLRRQLTIDAGGRSPTLLFRGQADSDWPLTTTLERADCEGMSFAEYYRLTVHRVRPAVESLTGTEWDTPDYGTAMERSFLTDRELFSLHRFPSVGLYRYLVYLRHHGFPSPLLDWTSSEHVAAFFAFRETSKAEKRSIYVYCESPDGIKGGAIGEPSIRAIGKYVRTHARHFRQQSDYTICAAFDQGGAGWRFYRHDPVFGSRPKQDLLWKFDIPSSKRIVILKELDRYNLNAFSLFDSQETLLETMWLREQVLDMGFIRAEESDEMRLPPTSSKLAQILKEQGYSTHPKGMAQPFNVDFDFSSDQKTASLDVNAEAVRRGEEVPLRPIRLTWEKVETEIPNVWKLKSVVELQPGVPSRALDRQPETPKSNAPWPI